jgi:dihydrofolate reductase
MNLVPPSGLPGYEEGAITGSVHEEDVRVHTRVIEDAEELTTLKQEPGKDIAILGSSDLTASLLQMGLVDEVRITVNPVVLGAGESVFGRALTASG